MSIIRIKTGGASVAYTNNDDALNNLNVVFSKLKTSLGDLLSPISVKNYVNKINRISILTENKPFTNINFLLDSNKVINDLQNSHLKSKKDYLSAISKLLQAMEQPPEIIKEYQNAMNTMKQEQYITRNENIATEQNAERSLNMKDIKKKMNSYKFTNDEELQKILIVNFYFGNTENLVPRNDLINMKIISPTKAKKTLDPLFNYLVVNNQGKAEKIILNSYKTFRTYGEQSFNISDNLTRLLFTYLKKFNKHYNDYLFTRRDGITPYNNSTFSRIIECSMNDVLGTPINIDLVRQIVITNFHNLNPLASINEKSAFARRFLHSSSQNLEYIKQNIKH